jgi:hypothetical protein
MKSRFKMSKRLVYGFLAVIIFVGTSIFIAYQYRQQSLYHQQVLLLSDTEKRLHQQVGTLDEKLKSVTSEDQFVKNKKQEAEIKNIHDSYKKTVEAYENLLKLKEQGGKTDKLDPLIAQSLTYLADQNYASASATLTDLNMQIDKEKQALAQKAAEFKIAANIPANNAPPASGFAVQRVQSDVGEFQVAIISADMGSTRVIVDTASDSDCKDNCPVLALGDYVARSGAYAGINGSYFCPSTYPSCAGKTNSFDLLAMNKNKHYFNSDNNVYSTNPVVVFGSGFVRFVGQGSGWGRDTGVDGVLMNYPLLVSGGQAVGDGGSDPKMGSKGLRGFVANKGNTVYIGITYNATVGENAHVLKTLGMENAMNLDSGGSTALWFNGYKAGPGRGIPNAILFVRK